MDVKKIFVILITVVACIAVGTAIYDATGIALDLNGDGVNGSTKLSTNSTSKVGTANGTINTNGGLSVGGYGQNSKTKGGGK